MDQSKEMRDRVVGEDRAECRALIGREKVTVKWYFRECVLACGRHATAAQQLGVGRKEAI